MGNPPTNPSAPPPIPSPPLKFDVIGAADTEVNPVSQALKWAEGFGDSGIIEDWIVALLSGAIRLVAPLIRLAMSLFDAFLAAIAEAFAAAQAQRTPGYYALVAAMMSDLTGITVDGQKLYDDFAKKGRLGSMVTLGGSLFNALASEFAGVEQTKEGDAFETRPGAGIGGLPTQPLSPVQGVKAAQAFLGFVSAFAVREGNADMLADFMNVGNMHFGDWFKEFAADFAGNLGIGRLTRLALKPLMDVMVSTPLEWALNLQYRPKLLGPADAVDAWQGGYITRDAMLEQFRHAGYSEDKIAYWQYKAMQKPSLAQIDTLVLGGAMTAADESEWLHRYGLNDEVIALMRQARDLEFKRKTSLAAAQRFLQEYISGVLTEKQFGEALAGRPPVGQGTLLLTDAERSYLKDIAAELRSYPRKQLTPSQLRQAYIDGTVSLSEYEGELQDMGYSADQVTISGIEALIRAKKIADAAAKQAASGKKGTGPAGAATGPEQIIAE